VARQDYILNLLHFYTVVYSSTRLCECFPVRLALLLPLPSLQSTSTFALIVLYLRSNRPLPSLQLTFTLGSSLAPQSLLLKLYVSSCVTTYNLHYSLHYDLYYNLYYNFYYNLHYSLYYSFFTTTSTTVSLLQALLQALVHTHLHPYS
jgi:hypothetical protein